MIKIIVGIFIVILVVLFILETKVPSINTKIIKVAGRNITVSVADTYAKHEIGLGGRSALSQDEGMLFVFLKDDLYSFWMKDMLFSIDIVWLSSDGKVITIVRDVSPATYPNSFVSIAPARYVVELPAGFSKKYNLKEGDIIRL